MLPLLAEDHNAVISLESASPRVPENKVVRGHSGDGGVGEDERSLRSEGKLTADSSDDGMAEQRLHLGLEDMLRAEVSVLGGAGPLCGDEEMLVGAQ